MKLIFDKKKWRLDNIELIHAKGKIYREKNKEQRKRYYEKNKTILIKKNKEYIEKNKEKRLAYLKQYYQKNKQHLQPANRLRYKKNSKKYLLVFKKYRQEWEKRNRDRLNKSNLKKAEKLAKPLNLKAYDYKNYLQSWSEEVRKRDQTCQICGLPCTVSHHILYKSKFPQLSFNLNNGLALCDPCHYETHKLNPV
jgi:hypothetical protein